VNDLAAFGLYCRQVADTGHGVTCPDLGTRRKTCPGCVSDTDQAWFARLADEVDAHYARQDAERLGATDDQEALC
jgi:hypothetical protein